MRGDATAPVVDASAWTRLIEALTADVDALADRTARRMRAELGSFAALEPEDVAPPVRDLLTRLLARLAERRVPDDGEDGSPYVALGEIRAAQAVSIDDVLAAWRIGLAELRGLARASVEPGAAAVLLEFIELTIAWADFAMHHATVGHRQVELERLRQEQHHVANVVRRVLFTGAAPTDLRAAAETYGIDLRARYHAVRARPSAAAGLRDLERYLETGASAGRRAGLVALVEGDVTGFVSRLPARRAPVAIGISPAVPLHGLQAAFRLATRALETATALGTRGVFALADLGLHPAVLADHEVGQALVERYVRPLERQGASGRVLLQTVERYLANDSRLEVTAQELCVHVNTVRYRLSRFEEHTACSLRETETLVEVWWALQRRRLADA